MAKSKRKSIRVSERMQKILDGEISLEELDDEEIFKGQIRAENGSFQGRPSDMIPRKFYNAATNELLKRWQQKVNEHLEPALKVLHEIASNPKAPADARYKSAVYLIERAAGKVPEKTEMKVEMAPWEGVVEGLFYDPEKKTKKKREASK